MNHRQKMGLRLDRVNAGLRGAGQSEKRENSGVGTEIKDMARIAQLRWFSVATVTEDLPHNAERRALGV